MPSRREKMIQCILAERQAIKNVGLPRRELLKLGFIATAGGLLLPQALRLPRAYADDEVISPPTTPFVEELPIPPVKQPVAPFTPQPPSGGFQFINQFPPVEFYELRVRQALHSFHPQLQPTPVWGYDGIVPGPLLQFRYGRPVLIRYRNELPRSVTGFGSSDIIAHFHNFHSGTESDGYPGNFFPTGTFRDHHHTMAYAGFTQPQFAPLGDPREALYSLWYHDHRIDFTGDNVYRGLAGVARIFDDVDSGDETDPNPQALRLPSGAFDVPLALTDRTFFADGQLFFDTFDFDGFLGDKFTVNGKTQPFFRVARRKYRFRILDASLSRYYHLWLRKDGQFLPFDYYIANDGDLLERPIRNVQSLQLWSAKRHDVIIDFSKFRLGDQIFLVDRLQQDDPRRARFDELTSPGLPLLRFDVDRNAPDPSRVPDFLREQPPINLGEVVRQREWIFNRRQGQWAINNELWNGDVVSATIRRNTAELWTLKNGGGGWSHPIHIHLESHRIISRNGRPPAPIERGRVDTTNLAPGEEVVIFMRFRDFLGRYVMHCHNNVHEDHAMMLRFDLVP